MSFFDDLRRAIVKGFFLFLILIPLVVAFLTNPEFESSTARPTDRLKEASSQDLERHVRQLASISPARNFRNQQSLSRAGEYIKKVWSDQGYVVTSQRFEAGGATYENLIVTVGPEDAPSRIVVGAHYDVHEEQPGADDNASGVAGLLELTRLMKPRTPSDKRIDFVAYTTEEPPFFGTNQMGSAVHAESLLPEKAKIKLMISLEMIGYFSDQPNSQNFPVPSLKYLYPNVGNFIAVIGNPKSWMVTRQVKTLMRSRASIPVESLNAPGRFPGVGLSDHVNYWHRGIPAVMITDTAMFRNDNYHKETDTPDTLDFGRMAEVVNGVLGVLTEL